MDYLANLLIKKYDVKCYKKNKTDKLYSFRFKTGTNKYITEDLLVDRLICKEFKDLSIGKRGLTINELRGIKKYLRSKCELINE